MKFAWLLFLCASAQAFQTFSVDSGELNGFEVSRGCEQLQDLCPGAYVPSLDLQIDTGQGVFVLQQSTGNYGCGLHGAKTCEETLKKTQDYVWQELWEKLEPKTVGLSTVEDEEYYFHKIDRSNKIACYLPVAKLQLKADTQTYLRNVTFSKKWVPCPDWFESTDY